MTTRIYTKACIVLAASMWAGPASAQNPVAFITASTGSGATRGDTGDPYLTGSADFSDFTNGIAAGQSVVTGADGTATITLPTFGTVIHLEASSEITVDRLPSLSGEIPVSFTLRAGGALVVRRGSEDRWFLIAGAAASNQGYALLQGASLAVRVEPAGVTFAALKGTSFCFKGAVPGGALIGAAPPAGGKRGLVDPSGVSISDGQSVSTRTWAPPAPDRLADAVAASMTRELYSFGLAAGAQWIERAEQGDLTPVRGAGRGSPELLRGEISAGLAFDQPRSIVAAPTSRAVTQPIRSAPTAVSAAQSRLESGIPSSVIIGQRLRRTRIIGSPGTSGPIRFNPNAEQLIRLPGN